MALKGLMLDMDGTLIHFQIDYSLARARAREILERYGYPPKFTEKNFVLEMVEIAGKFFQSSLNYSAEKIQMIKKKVDDSVAEIEREASFLARPLNGIERMLEFAKKSELKLGIITLNTTSNALLSLKNAGLAPYFQNSDLIIGRDRTSRPKPHVAHAHTLLDRMKLAPSDVCLIGDHPSDIETANKVNSRSIAIISEKHPLKEFKTLHSAPQENPSPSIISILQSFIEE
ncbi:HAD family hydrolase [Candidatus Lokiarchaeum ossiferum]|uniref:HAD family hydrolase n=1 Tax=Candidatus Lokiarchaeum ossiferum TaxID=2951803 RepID=UPI00352FC2A9